MARQLPSGTPTRSSRYIFPATNRRLFYGSLVAGLILLAAIVGLYFAGVPQFSSPGDLATQHAPVDLRCEQCHSTRTVAFVDRGVIDVRCERCHDPGGSARLTNAAHVLLGSGDSLKAGRAGAVPCVQCHTDHRGRAFKLRTVDDRECATCHGFASLAKHPEFAVIKASIQTGLGIRFDHDRHVVEAVKKTGEPCSACHRATADLVTFDPLSFDRHCAACHTQNGFVNGKSDAISPDLLTLPGQGEVMAVTTAVQLEPAARGRVAITNMRHRDPWVLYNALRLRRAIDPEGESSERIALRGQLAFLEQQLRIEPLSGVQRSNLERWAATLDQDIRNLDARIAAKAAQGDDAKALGEMTAAVRQIAGALNAAKAPSTEDAAALATEAVDTAPGAATNGSEGGDAARFDARKKELLSLLDAVAARGDKALSDRAAALKSQVERLSPASGDPDRAALSQGLLYLDEVFRAVRKITDPEAQVEAARLGVLREFAQQRVAGGLSPEEFEDRRRELIGILDAIDRTGGDAIRPRVAELRQRVAALRPGTVGDEGLRRLRDQKLKTLGRVKLEIELQAQGGGEAAPSVVAPVRDRREVEATIARVRALLAEVEGGPRPGAALTPEDLEVRKVALESLLGPCVKCHELRGPRLAPVTIAQPVMPNSIFNHRPHVTATPKCESCHATIDKSKYATDINEPSLANCQQCHAPSKSRSDCGTCHVYHPPSVAKLLRTS